MAQNTSDFENLSFNPFLVGESQFPDNNDPDGNFFNDSELVSFETPYMFDYETKQKLQDIKLMRIYAYYI